MPSRSRWDVGLRFDDAHATHTRTVDAHRLLHLARGGRRGLPADRVDSGAQPAEVFGELLERAWADPGPTLHLVADGSVCGPNGCPV